MVRPGGPVGRPVRPGVPPGIAPPSRPGVPPGGHRPGIPGAPGAPGLLPGGPGHRPGIPGPGIPGGPGQRPGFTPRTRWPARAPRHRQSPGSAAGSGKPAGTRSRHPTRHAATRQAGDHPAAAAPECATRPRSDRAACPGTDCATRARAQAGYRASRSAAELPGASRWPGRGRPRWRQAPLRG
jgi:hypothetical protein